MLSIDELRDGIPFILKIADPGAAPRHWIEPLSGATAEHWYNIYRNSDWRTLRAEHAEVFRHPATEDEAERLRRSRRCVVIHVNGVAEERARNLPKPEQQAGSSDT
jgi:hypothetical protein